MSGLPHTCVFVKEGGSALIDPLFREAAMLRAYTTDELGLVKGAASCICCIDTRSTKKPLLAYSGGSPEPPADRCGACRADMVSAAHRAATGAFESSRRAHQIVTCVRT